jgi:hypothetical protein
MGDLKRCVAIFRSLLWQAMCVALLAANAVDAFATHGMLPKSGRGAERFGLGPRRPGGLALLASSGGGLADGAARRYWDGMNRRDVDYALEQFSDNIFFQDMLFQEPIRGKEQLRAHFDR